MSSVSRYARQIPVSTTYYNAQTVVGAPQTYVFEFVPSSSNYVGNYPNGFNDYTGGYVQQASAALQNGVSAAVNQFGTATLLLRDMGKTIFAPIYNAGVGATSNWGHFRQVQLITPAPINQTAPATGFMGGTSGPTFGVIGAANTPDIYTDYLTFYIPVSVAGITGAGVNTQAFAIAGGQM